MVRALSDIPVALGARRHGPCFATGIYLSVHSADPVRWGRHIKNTLKTLFVCGFFFTANALAEVVGCDESKLDCEHVETQVLPENTLSLAGPEQVENRLHTDSSLVTPMFPSSFAKGYFDWKERINKDHGVDIGGDYSTAWLGADNSAGEDSAFGGMYRFFGSW